MYTNEEKWQQENQSQSPEQLKFQEQTQFQEPATHEVQQVYYQQSFGMGSTHYIHKQQIENAEHTQNLNKKVPFWRIWLVSFAFLVLHLIVLSLSGIIASAIKIATNPVKTQQEMINLLMSSDVQNWACVIMGLICIPLYIVFLKKRNHKYNGSLGWHKLTMGSVSSMSLAAVGSLGMVTGLLLLLQELSKYIPYIEQKLKHYQELTELVVSKESNIILQIVATAIIVPIAEELLFRGIVLGELNFRYSPRTVVLLQAVLFGLFHMNFVQSLYTFIPGLLLGIAYYYTGNIIMPIIMHVIFNLFGGVLTVFLSEKILNYINYIELATGFFSLITIIIFFIKAKPYAKHKLQWERNYPQNV
ncbi:MAG TPA: CPBP family intramembrane metalloprotease [Clostridiaceae bacterium]|nr:CPBP family intramembrane metalloprotease [Clostridiaceae bacterium]